MIFYFINVFFILFNNIISIKLNVNKIEKNFNNSTYFALLNYKIRYLQGYSSIDLPLVKFGIGLYTVDIYIGEPSQKFSVIIDSGSAVLWVYDKDCLLCLSKNKFAYSKSKTFKSKKESIELNYVTGDLKGYLCQDNMYFKETLVMPFFNFLLIYESNLDFEVDGIIGLSKGAYINKEYSFLNQLSDKKIIKENYYIYDLYNKYFYIGETPLYLAKEKKITCYVEEFSKSWSCEMHSIKIDNIPIYTNTRVIFDSGTNGIVFPMKYIEFFKLIISNNAILMENNCFFQPRENKGWYKFVCSNIDGEIKDLNYSNYFIEIFFEEKIGGNYTNKTNSIGFKLIDLFEKDENNLFSFSIYIFDINDEILLGAPFFEKYPVMFDKDNNAISIFGNGNNPYSRKKKLTKLVILLIITFVIIFILLILIIVREVIVSKRRLIYSQVDFVKKRNLRMHG